MQFAVARPLKDDYQHYFKHVIRSWWTADYTLATAVAKYTRRGKFMEPAVIGVLSLRMLNISRATPTAWLFCLAVPLRFTNLLIP